MQLLAQSMDGSMDRSPGALQAREAMDHNVSLSEEPEPGGSSRSRLPAAPPIDRALFNGDQWAGRGLDLQLTIDLTAHQMAWAMANWMGASAAGGSRAGRLRDSSN